MVAVLQFGERSSNCVVRALIKVLRSRKPVLFKNDSKVFV